MNYSKLKFFFLFSLASLCAAAGVTKAVHIPRDGDAVDFQRCEVLNPGSSGVDAVWDFSEAVPVGESHRVKYLSVGDSLLIRTENAAMHTFLLKGDSVLWTGCENRLSALTDSIAPLHMLLPMEYGDSITTPLYMVGNYCGNNALTMLGSHTVHIDGKGTLILSGDTIKNVMRMHVLTTAKVKVAKDNMRQSLTADSDSLIDKVEEKYLWFSDNYRFPLAEVRLSNIGVGTLEESCSAVSYICPPAVQDYALGTNFSPLVNSPSADSNTGNVDTGNEVTIIQNLMVNTGNGFMDVSFIPGASGMVSLVLTDVYGRVFASIPKKAAQSGVAYSDRVDVSRLPSGSYVLYVNVANETQNRKFTIK